MSGYEIAIDCDYGADESFMVDSEEQARKIAREYMMDADTRRVWLFNVETGETLIQWSKS